MNRVVQVFTRPFDHFEKVEFFRTILYIFLIVNTISLLPIIEDLFGYYGLIGTRGWNTNIPFFKQGSYGLINFLSHPANSKYDWVFLLFVVGQLFFLVIGLLRKLPIISSVMIYFFTVNLFLKGYLAFTGGEVLVNLTLFYLIFIQKPKKTEGFFHDLQHVLSNTFYWIILIQICILYFFSSLYKLFDYHWYEGTAVMYVSRIDAYSSFLFETIFSENVVLSMSVTYITLAYQILFPVLVWFKKIKIPFLIIGTLFHLGIAFGMGLFTFGAIMIIVYIMFLEEDHIQKMKQLFLSAVGKKPSENA